MLIWRWSPRRAALPETKSDNGKGEEKNQKIDNHTHQSRFQFSEIRAPAPDSLAFTEAAIG